MVRFRRINTRERRASRRVRASEVIPYGVTRLATGQEIRLVNIALNGGVLIHSKTMLSPGAVVRIKLSTSGSEMILEGRVHRCKVIGLKQAIIQYEAVILLEEGFPEPLAERLQHLNDSNSPTEQCSQEFNPDVVMLPDTAQLWILNGHGAEVPA
jgi:hypothetical protein